MPSPMMTWPLNRRGLLTHVHRPRRRSALSQSLETLPSADAPVTTPRI